VVRNDTEQRKATPTADVPAGVRARSFAGTQLDIDDKNVARAVLARADDDFDRIFGSD
jgi:hypothetical protein